MQASKSHVEAEHGAAKLACNAGIQYEKRACEKSIVRRRWRTAVAEGC